MRARCGDRSRGKSAGAGIRGDIHPGELVEWADLILVMEKEHRHRLNRKFGKALGGKRVVVLPIPDDHE